MRTKIIKSISFVILTILFCGYISIFQNDRCDCFSKDHSYRSFAKHDTVLAKLPERKTFITTETIRSWEKKYPIDVMTEQNATERIPKTPEDTIYNLKGWLYEVKTNKSDCDLHLQVGMEDPKMMRVDIEIPLEECKLQNEVLKELAKRNFKFDDQNKKGIYFEAKGPAFFDGANRGRPGKKHTGGCSWEMHPVRQIIFK